MKIPYLGRIDLFWCFDCNVPVLAKKCAACAGNTEKVLITPPGDVRPAFEKDIDLLNRTVEKQFGTPLVVDDRIVLLNSVPGFDRFDEVIIDGVVVGVLKYDVERLCFEFMPRLEGGARIWNSAAKGLVTLAPDAGEYIRSGKSVLLPGVVSFDEDIQKGQEVLVICEDVVIGVGRARFSGEEAKNRKKGMFVKVRKHAKSDDELRVPPGGQDFELLLSANKDVIGVFEREAVEFIKRVLNERGELPAVVSFSGGKDSLATLLLVRKVIDIPVVFVDTGLEFPETLEYITELAELLDLDLIISKAGERFWRGLDVFGMSGRDYRWCCKVCKLGPISKVMHERFPEGFLNFIGQRRYESEIRARSGRIWRNSWLPKQLSASPIQNWNALHIWLFLIKEDIPTNPLYHLGFERIGCWVCPSSALAEVEFFKELHPDMWMKFSEKLIAQGFTEKEVEHGFWRWKKLPKGQEGLRDMLKLGRSLRKTKPRRHDDDRERVSNLSASLGCEITEDLELRSANCLGCGMCLAHCDYDAIDFSDGKIWINDNCVGCGRCHSRCPIVKYI